MPSGSTSEANPFLSARAAWQDRYAPLVLQARNWRMIALFSMLSTIMSLALVWHNAMRNPFVAFPVLIDSLGRTVSAGVAPQLTAEERQRVYNATLQTFVTEWRSVTSDKTAQLQYIDRVFARVSSGSIADKIMKDQYRANDPTKRTDTVSVAVHSVLKHSEKSYEIDWTETPRDRSGQEQTPVRWRGSFTVATATPPNETAARLNPLGLYVTDINLSQVTQ